MWTLTRRHLLSPRHSPPAFGAYIAQLLLRKAVEGKEDALTETETEARTILEDALRVLFYRDARSINQVRCFLRSWRSRSSVFLIVPNSEDNREWGGYFGFVEARDSLELCRGHKRIWRSDAVDEINVSPELWLLTGHGACPLGGPPCTWTAVLAKKHFIINLFYNAWRQRPGLPYRATKYRREGESGKPQLVNNGPTSVYGITTIKMRKCVWYLKRSCAG
jgi:hypothetical protein